LFFPFPLPVLFLASSRCFAATAELILRVFNTSYVISKDDFLLDIGVAPKISIPGTLQEKGLGIGLFMIFQLINKIKGEIEFKIHEEGGFTAFISLKI
jgi:sensor histidine kinase regulating citrate/malate metabolism